VAGTGKREKRPNKLGREYAVSWISETAEGVWIQVLVQPRAAKNAVVGPQGDRLKIKLTAPPVEGAANRMCREFLAKVFRVRKSQVEMISGQKSRAKKFLIRSVTSRQIQARLSPSN
jgi:hypothetical protein